MGSRGIFLVCLPRGRTNKIFYLTSMESASPHEIVRLGSLEVVLPPLLTPKGGPFHKLSSAWAFWAQKKVKKAVGGSWYEGTACLGRFDTVEGFWMLYTRLMRAEAVSGSADLMLFRDGVRPMWEDDANRVGGKYTLRIRKAGAGIMWEELVMLLVGEALDAAMDVCGAILSLRYHDTTVAIWHRTADNDSVTSRLR